MLLGALALVLEIAFFAGCVAITIYQQRESLGKLILRRTAETYCVLWHNLRANRPAPVPETGAAIIAANHVCNLDPVFIQCTTPFRVVSFFMAAEYLKLWWFKPVYDATQVIPVTRTGHDTGPALAGLRALRQGRILGIFPEGGINTRHDRIGPPQPGVALLALRARVPVVPAFISRDLHTHSIVDTITRRSPTKVYYGKPLVFMEYYGRKITEELLNEVADRIMDAIGALAPCPVRVVHTTEEPPRPKRATQVQQGRKSASRARVSDRRQRTVPAAETD